MGDGRQKKREKVGAVPKQPSPSLLELAILLNHADPATRVEALLELVANNPLLREKYRRRGEQKEERLRELADHHGVAHGDYRSLALALARELYPAGNKPGPVEKWTEPALGVLLAEVDALTESGQCKDEREATRRLAEQGRWRAFLRSNDLGNKFAGSDPVEALRRALQKAKKNEGARFIKDARALLIASDPGRWDELVRNALTRRRRRVKN